MWPNWRRVRTCDPGAFQKDRLGASSIAHDGHPAWTRLEPTALALRALPPKKADECFELLAANGAAIRRLARRYEADPDRQRDLLKEMHIELLGRL